MAKFKALLTPERVKAADASRGRLQFSRTCAQCHKLFDAGGDVGPELTGSDRANLDYVLGNVLDPSAAVAGDYTLKIIGTNDGRVLSGIFRSQDDKAVVLQTANERIVIPRSDIEAFTLSTISMMPEGLFDRLSDAEVADLVARTSAAQGASPPRGRIEVSPGPDAIFRGTSMLSILSHLQPTRAGRPRDSRSRSTPARDAPAARRRWPCWRPPAPATDSRSSPSTSTPTRPWPRSSARRCRWWRSSDKIRFRGLVNPALLERLLVAEGSVR